MGLGMAGKTLKVWMIAGLASVALTACEPGTGSDPASDGPITDGLNTDGAITSGPIGAATSVRLVDHDVEAPEVFQTTDKALWDGRPSLGGVWVASATAKNPERVIMRNPANGKFVIGGLFQRDSSLPGPKLQLSSDAAEALGLLAGSPATINVTALRRDEAPAPKPNAKAPLLDANEPVGTPAAKPAKPSKDVTALAAAAIDESPAPTAAQPAPSGSGALIQVGIFSVEANAKRAMSLLSKAGVAANLSKDSSHGKDSWSVTARGNAALLAKIKSAGFKDAYVLKR